MEKIKTSTNCKESTELERHTCTLMNKDDEVSGIIEVKINAFTFISDRIKLSIPWKQIESIEKEDKMFNDYLVVMTLKGPIKFKQIESLVNTMASVREAHEKGIMGNSKKIQRKPEVEFSQTDISFILKRKL